MAATVSSCHHIDDHRLPISHVNLVFQTQADWVTHGVSGAGQSKRFIIEKHIPADFFYTAAMSTGMGGILLCTDYSGQVMAYDLACPVECRADVRVSINSDNLAECERCHSTYDVFSLYGSPRSGTALEKGYGLQRYNVYYGTGGAWLVVR